MNAPRLSVEDQIKLTIGTQYVETLQLKEALAQAAEKIAELTKPVETPKPDAKA